jgi:hypothetical protein
MTRSDVLNAAPPTEMSSKVTGFQSLPLGLAMSALATISLRTCWRWSFMLLPFFSKYIKEDETIQLMPRQASHCKPIYPIGAWVLDIIVIRQE